MSWVFLAGDKVYKLKKPVLLPYLDFSTLRRREVACRAEIDLNRRLAPDVYLGVSPLTASPQGLSIGGHGTVADWLVVMRRLEERWELDRAIEQNRVSPAQLDRLVMTLGRFYRRARRPYVCPAAQLLEWNRGISANCHVLLDRRLDLPSGIIRSIEHAQRRFLGERPERLVKRIRDRRIVDGHGDLRPEHIWLTRWDQDHRLLGVQCSAENSRSFLRDRLLEPRMSAARGPLDRRLRHARRLPRAA